MHLKFMPNSGIIKYYQGFYCGIAATSNSLTFEALSKLASIIACFTAVLLRCAFKIHTKILAIILYYQAFYCGIKLADI
jgi:hypothetical protein